MNFKDLFIEMYLGVSSNKVRSGLTMLGIVIGIASVIAMLSIGQGAKKQIEENIQSIGSNLLLVMPGAQRGVGVTASAGRGSAQTLSEKDVETIKAIPGVKAVEPETTRRYQVTAVGKNTNTQIVGTTPEYLPVRNIAIESGTFVSAASITSRSKVAVLGPTTRDDLFGEGANPIGSSIRINGIPFTVIGMTVAKGGSGFSNQDDIIYIPFSTMSTFLSGSDSINTIGVQAVDAASMATAQEAITAALLANHNVTTPDFSVLNQSDLVNAASSVTNTFTALLASIAGISLLVGGIGIMNMMLTTVTERTREIGLRKAIGAERHEIVNQFLGEAIFLTLMGGGIGILLGFGVSRLVTALTQTPTIVSWFSVALATGVSALIGLIFGFYPAHRAARLSPIEALRYE